MPGQNDAASGANAMVSCLTYSACSISMVRCLSTSAGRRAVFAAPAPRAPPLQPRSAHAVLAGEPHWGPRQEASLDHRQPAVAPALTLRWYSQVLANKAVLSKVSRRRRRPQPPLFRRSLPPAGSRGHLG